MIIYHFVLFLDPQPGASGTTKPPQKKQKAAVSENELYEASFFVVDLSTDEKEKAERALSSFDNSVDGLEELFQNTKMLQRCYLHLSLTEQFSKFPWLPEVSIFFEKSNFL